MKEKLLQGIRWIQGSRGRIAGVAVIALLLITGIVYLSVSAMGNREEMKGSEDNEEVSAEETGQENADEGLDEEDENKDLHTEDDEDMKGDEEPEESSPPDPSVDEEDESKGQDPQQQRKGGSPVDIGKVTESNTNMDGISYGIDVSKWQGVIDWKQVKDSGIDFAMIRVGYRTIDKGVIVEDPFARYNLQEAVKHGIPVGAYFFSTSVDEKEALAEAKWVADFIRSYPIDYPVAHNTEHFNESYSRQKHLTKKERSDLAKVFLDEIKRRGYTPMFYAAQSEMENDRYWNASELGQRYKIWVAQYPARPYPETPKSSYSRRHEMWQYTSQGRVPGISGPVDLNVAYFSVKGGAEAKDDSPREDVTADPGALLNFREVNETVTAKIKTNLRTEPSSAKSETIVGELKNGETLKRTGIADNGWSRLEYQGKTVYAVTDLLTTDLDYREEVEAPPEKDFGMVFENRNKDVTAKDHVNLRSQPSTQNGEVKDVLRFGDVAKLTGISDSGWARLEYKENTLYAVYSFLTDDLNYQENQKPKEPEKPDEPDPEAGMVFSDRNEKVTAKELTNLRSEPSTSGGSETVVTSLKHGDIATRTGISDSGWSRLEYNGKTLYAVSSFLEKTE